MDHRVAATELQTKRKQSMSKFKIGDRVLVSGKNPTRWCNGMVGIVVSAACDAALLQFTPVAADGRGHGPGKTQWYVNNGDLDLQPSATTAPSAAADLRLTPQAKTILRHLKALGSISPMQALAVYGYTRLASCIHEIRRKAGYTVDMDYRKDAQGHRYARYSLAKALVVH